MTSSGQSKKSTKSQSYPAVLSHASRFSWFRGNPSIKNLSLGLARIASSRRFTVTSLGDDLPSLDHLRDHVPVLRAGLHVRAKEVARAEVLEPEVVDDVRALRALPASGAAEDEDDGGVRRARRRRHGRAPLPRRALPQQERRPRRTRSPSARTPRRRTRARRLPTSRSSSLKKRKIARSRKLAPRSRGRGIPRSRPRARWTRPSRARAGRGGRT